MFTGIIETIGTIQNIERKKSNLIFTVQSTISNSLKIDQSVAHNGVCLTVINIDKNTHQVEAIQETLQKSNLNSLILQDKVNLERCTPLNGRLDGHIVQGHVDQVGKCIDFQEMNGSTVFTFEYSENEQNLVVEKGSICVNGVSLTAFQCAKNKFSVAIIPYTLAHTNLQSILKGSYVNLEFDIIGKYVSKIMELQR